MRHIKYTYYGVTNSLSPNLKLYLAHYFTSVPYFVNMLHTEYILPTRKKQVSQAANYREIGLQRTIVAMDSYSTQRPEEIIVCTAFLSANLHLAG